MNYKNNMINENLKFEKKEGKVYPTLPKGIYQCELLDVSTMENETYNSKMGKTNGVKQFQTDLVWQFVLLVGRDENQEEEEWKELRGRSVWENFGHNFLYEGKNGKNNLYRIVEAFLGRDLTREEVAMGISATQLNGFIGKQINVSVEPKKNKSGNRVFDNITDYFKVNSELTPLTAEEKEKSTVKEKKGESLEEPVIQVDESGEEMTPEDVALDFNGKVIE